MRKLHLMLFSALFTVFLLMAFVSANAEITKKPYQQASKTTRQPVNPPQPFDSGGPDAYGYVWIDSEEPGGPVYDWVDITGNGTQIVMDDDDNQGPFGMDFTFNFYGTDFDAFRICSNGFLSFTDSSSPYSNLPIPGSSAPLNLVAGFWDDLNPNQGGAIYYYTSADSTIVSYINVPHWSSGGVYTFQIILHSSGQIIYQYNSMGSQTNSATVGIQNNDGSIGLQVVYNQSYVVDELAVRFSIGGAGYIAGTVTDEETGEAIEGALVSAGGASDETNQDGEYLIEIANGIYDVTSSAEFYNDMTIEDVEVTEGDTTTVDFALLHGEIDVDDSPIIVYVRPGETHDHELNIGNTGNGLLTFSIRTQLNALLAGNGGLPFNSGGDEFTETSGLENNGDFPVILDFGDLIWGPVDIETPTGDNLLLGCEFDGEYYWVTGAADQITPKLYKLDTDLQLVDVYDQAGHSSGWGWRDMAFDGEYLYASVNNNVDQIDPATGEVTGVTIPGPEFPNRALAYDPETDHFWTANFSSFIYEFDRDGNIYQTLNNTLPIYGLAWDDLSDDGPWLWVHHHGASGQEMIVDQFDPRTGAFTGVSFSTASQAGDIAGGAALIPEGNLAALLVLGQGAPDFLSLYEVGSYSTWMTVNPTSGEIQPGGNMAVTLHFDATGDEIQPDTTYDGLLIINNNSAEPTVTIPVTMDTRTTGVEEDGGTLPSAVSLSQNYPNPFNPETIINYALPSAAYVKLEVFNVAGQRVSTLIDGMQSAGYQEVLWDGTDGDNNRLSSGIYLYKLSVNEKTMVKKMSLLK
ncbi:MAG: T9SS type A sorting domain-containing protein [candidate division Zixibacteria bacterium]|nr:T9SS type A sorting domain-containing protein [candidate division Zixibacteria bacterium]